VLQCFLDETNMNEIDKFESYGTDEYEKTLLNTDFAAN